MVSVFGVYLRVGTDDFGNMDHMILAAVNLFHEADSFVFKVQVTVNLLLFRLLINYLSTWLFAPYRFDVVFLYLLLPSFLMVLQLRLVDKIHFKRRMVFYYFAKKETYSTHYAIAP